LIIWRPNTLRNIYLYSISHNQVLHYQKEILSRISNKPNKRKIYWYYDINGNIGKSFLAKYICLSYKGVIIADGKKDNIFNQINKSINEDNEEPEIIILDIPRYNMCCINYGVIEQIKNGFIYSGKYEGGKCFFKIPHIIIFANEEPDYEKWSKDRYYVKCLDAI
jgi:hypothetical protein